jgi:alpha-galactosidase
MPAAPAKQWLPQAAWKFLLAAVVFSLFASYRPWLPAASAAQSMKTQSHSVNPSSRQAAAEIIAARLDTPLPANAMPSEQQWSLAMPVTFDADWQGARRDPERRTEARLLWSPDTLYVRFICNYRTIDIFPDAEPSGRRDHLWERDVAEVFLQPDQFGTRHYKEFEVSPNGFWIDLDITPGGNRDLKSGLRRSVSVDELSREWTAVLAIPIVSITKSFDPTQAWRLNFYRCEALDPNRAYLAWQPTRTPQPNFHVPASFGVLHFAD